jgi:hypothetical protein
MIGDPMGSRSYARSRARPSRAATLVVARALRAGLVALGLGCNQASLDGFEPTPGAPAAETTGDTLPQLDTGESSSGGEASTGEPTMPDDPRLCTVECPLVLPVRWTYESVPPSRPSLPGSHAVPVMLREADGALLVAELREGTARLHRLDGEGRLQWNVPLPLPCDPCELTDVAAHPSGDLLLSATGTTAEGELTLFAARYDAVRHVLVWLTSRSLDPIDGVEVRSGDIAAVSDALVAQLYMRGQVDFEPLQSTRVAVYDTEGTLVEEDELVFGQATGLRAPLLARVAPNDELVVGVFAGSAPYHYGLTDRIGPPLWHVAGFAFPPAVLDDLRVDARGHALELGHMADGTHTHLLLSDRLGVDSKPRWVASVALASTSASTAALALGPDGDVYAAVRTTQALAEAAEPLVGLSLVRWTAQGELRWRTTLLEAIADGWNPVELAVDDDEGLVVAAVVDDRLRVERRAQGCACGG